MARRGDCPAPPPDAPDPEGRHGPGGVTAAPSSISGHAPEQPDDDDGLGAWSDSEIAEEQLEEQLEEDQDQLGGLPAYDDVLDLIVLDLDDDDDLGDDDAPAAPAQTSPTSSVAAPESTMKTPPALAAATSAGSCHPTNEYYTGLGKRLEQFAPLAVAVDPLDAENDNQGQLRDRLAVIERFRAQNALVAVDAEATATATATALARQDSGPPICRICRDTHPYGGTEDDAEAEAAVLGVGSLVSPCECRGTVAAVHMSCLERWLAESDSSCCELCGHQYVTIRTPSYGVLASIPAWIVHNGSMDLLFDIVAFIIFTPVTLFGTHLLGLNADDTPYFQVSIMAALDLVYSAWLAMRLHYHANRWYSWWRRKSTVQVILNKEEKKNKLADS